MARVDGMVLSWANFLEFLMGSASIVNAIPIGYVRGSAYAAYACLHRHKHHKHKLKYDRMQSAGARFLFLRFLQVIGLRMSGT